MGVCLPERAFLLDRVIAVSYKTVAVPTVWLESNAVQVDPHLTARRALHEVGRRSDIVAAKALFACQARPIEDRVPAFDETANRYAWKLSHSGHVPPHQHARMGADRLLDCTGFSPADKNKLAARTRRRRLGGVHCTRFSPADKNKL